MNAEQFYEWLAQTNIDEQFSKLIYNWYRKAKLYDSLLVAGVDNWGGYADAIRESYEGEDD